MTTADNGAAPLSLPATPNLEHLKKQAKQLLRAFRANAPDALQVVAAFHPAAANFAGLRDAQLTIARRYGFPDWQGLCEEVEMRQLRSGTLDEQAQRLVALACLHYNGDDRAYRHARAALWLREIPELARTNFYCALVAGNLDAVRSFLDRDPALATGSGGPMNWPALLYLTYSRVPAASDKVLGIVQLLLERGAAADSHVLLGDCRFTALTGALGEGERGPVDCPPHPHADELVAALLAAGADPNDSQGLYDTMFTDSIDKWLPVLIAHGLNSRQKANWNPDGPDTTLDFVLAQAVQYGKNETVRLLLDHGAHPDTVNHYNGRICHTNAVLYGHGAIAKLLAAHGARIEPLTAADELRMACWRNDRTRAQALLERHPELTRDARLFHDVATDIGLAIWLVARGFDINCQTHDGRTLLHRYVSGNQLDAIATLVGLGADPDLTEHAYGATPLGFALHDRAWNVVPFLVERSNDLLDLCRVANVSRTAELLAQNPALVHLRTTPMGNTPLHVVSQAHEEDPDLEASALVIELLLAHGADPQALNRDGLTPMQWYRKRGMDDLAEILNKRAERGD